MHPIHCNALNNFCRNIIPALRNQARHISLTGAIERGLRKTQRSLEKKQEPWRDQDRRNARQPRNERDAVESDRAHDSVEGEASRPFGRAPRSLPFTTASSEFVYGTFAVNAAIKARRRKLYKLYIHGQEDDRDTIGSASLKRRAEAAGVDVHKVTGPAWRVLLDRASEGRPHNGCVLEASIIPVLPALSLQNVNATGEALSIQVGQLSPEDTAISEAFGVQNNTAKINARAKQKRYPLVLLLDRVTDLGNLGAIIRSAYYFGVNAVILLDHGTAPLSGVTVKASAGAAELMPILKIGNETSFITMSKANGWHFVAAIAPSDTPLVNSRVLIPQHEISSDGLDVKPTVLMLGNEAEGLRPRLARMSNSTLTIQDAFAHHHGVDSLNVSVAAGILMHDLLRPFLREKPTGR